MSHHLSRSLLARVTVCAVAAVLLGACGDDPAGPVPDPDGTLAFSFSDPAGDTLPNTERDPNRAIDLLSIAGRYKPDSLIVQLRFAATVRPPSTGAANSLVGLVEFDTDENARTGGESIVDLFGGQSGLGPEYAAVFAGDGGNEVILINLISEAVVGGIPATFTGDLVTLRIPLSQLGGDDGNFKFAAIFGTVDRPTDIAPNSGSYLARRPAGVRSAAALTGLPDGERSVAVPRRGAKPVWGALP